jgi:hypothetical protein
MRISLSFLALTMSMPVGLHAQVSLSLTVGPPPMPVYAQPAIPGDGYSWEPGYWAWADGGYFWVPGTWVRTPGVGLLWTPGYWGWGGGSYTFHQGYWGTRVGFYGGINYGYGYGGSGFDGGHWQGRNYYYNRAVTNMSGFRPRNTYDRAMAANAAHVSYSGGQGGMRAAPNPQEQLAGQARHVQPTAEQAQHVQLASQNKQLQASVNLGKPGVAATARAGDFSPKGAVPAQAAGGPVPTEAPRAMPKMLPAGNPPAPRNPAHPQAQPGPGRPAAPVQQPPRQEARPQGGQRPAAAPHAAPEPRPGSAPSRPEPMIYPEPERKP